MLIARINGITVISIDLALSEKGTDLPVWYWDMCTFHNPLVKDGKWLFTRRLCTRLSMEVVPFELIIHTLITKMATLLSPLLQFIRPILLVEIKHLYICFCFPCLCNKVPLSSWKEKGQHFRGKVLEPYHRMTAYYQVSVILTLVHVWPLGVLFCCL